ncbi:MAG: phytanoyl-CoA dioxygenase family protein [Crocosphaera sp.]|nr:phytanoyl-CoA dioxygenase family protein [Crocosphaera sp.]
MLEQKQTINHEIEKNGFVIVKNVLNGTEQENLTKILKNHFKYNGLAAASGLTQSNAAVEVPEVNWLFYHPKILAVMRQLLGQQKIMFTSHCDLHCRTLSAWHKDDGMKVMEGGYFGYPTYDRADCKVYKVALYLQDHDHNRGGLTVKKGSHKFASISQGEEVYLQTKAGDIIIFDVRLTHTGQKDVVPLRLLKQPNYILKKGLNKIFKVSPQKTDQRLKKIYDTLFGDRLSIFFTYGLPNDYTKNFAINNMKRQLKQNKNSKVFLSVENRNKFTENNVILAEEYFEQLMNTQ